MTTFLQQHADNLLETNEFRSGVGARWTFLSAQVLAEQDDPLSGPLSRVIGPRPSRRAP